MRFDKTRRNTSNVQTQAQLYLKKTCCGHLDTVPFTVQSTYGEMYVLFVTDNTVAREGFRISYILEGAPNTTARTNHDREDSKLPMYLAVGCAILVESNCDKTIGCHDDGGSDSCGPFQIKEVYWIDCNRPGDSYEECTKDYKCAKGCVQAYMERYGGWKCGTTCEDYARMHNGGPKGYKKSATDVYWNKIRNAGCSSDS
ncbi:Lysozyme 3,Lysozyme,Lysozyme 2 [Mytilus edulis]|uniref:lysozyme n=1 Tax=Mytilus edulis TaxID=6550 RepID=A0A8S3UAX7_MYTED|nr:Lysozyme 3,Lysozyme,Lysozyme 2 [Mytilus edulis]